MIAEIAPVNSAPPPVQPPTPAPKPSVNPIEQLKMTVSASRLIAWSQCRLKFFFRYVEQITKPPTPSLHVGSVVHQVLKSWNMSRWKKQPFVLDQFKQVFDTGWVAQPDEIKWEDEEVGEKNGAWALLEMYFTETPIKANEMPEAVEVPVKTDLSKYGLPTLIGILDLVRAGGRIVDFKTAGKTSDAEDAIHMNEIQLSCHSVLYREATGKFEAGRELHFLIKTAKPKLVITGFGPMLETQRVRLFRIIESYTEGLEREDFVPSPGFQCCGCEFRTECRAWC
jgi:hypothetical protein